MSLSATSFYLSIVAFMAGIATAAYLELSYPTLLWLLGLAIIAALTWRRATPWVRGGWLLASLTLAFFVGGAVRFITHETTFGQSPLASQVGQSVSITGVVTKEPERRESSLHLYIENGDDTVLVTTDRYTSVRYGDELTVSGVLKQPELFTTELGRTFNYPEYLKVRDVEYQISFAEVVITRTDQGNLLIAILLSFKQQFLGALNEVLPEPVSGLAAGVLLGVKQSLGENLERAFRETGIIHIVVLSGYNIMLVISFITFVLGSFFSRRVTAVVSVLAIASFALMVGLSATVLRACLMASILLLAQVTQRHYLALRALLLVGMVMLLNNPYLLLYDIGFQLSFMATLGLILLAPYVERVCAWLPNQLSLRQFFAATVSTQIAVLPLLMFHIGEVSLVGVVVNLLVLPMVPFAMLFSFALGLASFLVPFVVPVLAALAYVCLAYVITVAEFFAALPLAAVGVSQFSLGALSLCYALMVILYAYLATRFPLREAGNVEPQSPKPETLSVADWTIEVEPDLTERTHNTKSVVAPEATTDNNTPIFFR